MADIPSDLFQRIAERANDPRRRTADASLVADAQPLDLGAMVGQLAGQGHPAAAQLQGMLGQLSSMFGGMAGLQQGLGNMVMVGPDGSYRMGGGNEASEPAPLADPPGEAALAQAARAIGRALPAELRQLYAIGDGGFGPGEGLMRLAEAVERHRKMTAEPFGPLGQPWPENLLPLFDENPALSCIDLDSGEIVAWDPEEIEDEDSDEDWQRSFKVEHPSLAAFMDAWLDTPTMAEQMEGARRQPFEVPQATIDFYAAMTPEERAEYGFEGEDWEEQLRKSFSHPYGGAQG
ncbi:MAG TPA: SMI1/KNR4 family protein [Sphingomicrobium sp.]|nr:SMI1/KNR4 family protein [Sphingomicrobium sp.]